MGEEFNSIISVIINNGAAIGCLIYFMYIQNTTMKGMKDSIDNLTKVVESLKVTIQSLSK